jgi:hypothetical protein
MACRSGPSRIWRRRPLTAAVVTVPKLDVRRGLLRWHDIVRQRCRSDVMVSWGEWGYCRRHAFKFLLLMQIAISAKEVEIILNR